ncbi:hypothetical protein [[Eubacterium] cellulosolvens]
MAKMVPVLCPQCGANLNLPQDLGQAFCTYCGSRINISKSIRQDHMGPSEFENYYELGRRAYYAHDYEGAVEYLEKALEIDVKSKKVNDLIQQAYYGLALYLINLSEEKVAVAKKEKRLSYGSGGTYMFDSDNDDIHDHLDDLEDEIDYMHLQRSNRYFQEAKVLEDRARIYFRKAGVCPYCFGRRYCPYCKGTGYCAECDGTGSEYLIMTCSECSGAKYCVHCRGWRSCPHCRGTGIHR